jgi:hypothetical protein
VLEFHKNSLTGQTLTLQQSALICSENCVCIIIQF